MEELAIPSSQDFLSFRFVGQSYKTAQNQLAYAYRLAGYDEAWRWTKSRHTDYADLPVGKYTFKVKAVD